MITYKLREQTNRGLLLKTYYRGNYIGESVGYWIGNDTLMVYPSRIYNTPPAGVELKRRIYIGEVER